MSVSEHTDRVLDRAARGEADVGEIEESIAATRADLDRNLSAIEQRLSSDELISQAMGYLRSGPTEFLSNFGKSVKENPVPATLMAVSIGWLMFGPRRGSGNGYAMNGRGAGDWAQQNEYEFDESGDSGGLMETGASAVHRVKDGVRERAAGLSDRAADLSDRASERASALAQRASSIGDRLSQTVSEVGGRMSDASKHAQEVFQTARERIAQARETIGRQPKRLQAGYQDMADNHPFVLGALAFVAGAAIAASIRRTQIEDEALGRYRDEALEEAERRARSELQRGVSKAKAALTAGSERNESGDQMEMEIEDANSDERQSQSSASQDTSGTQRESQDRFH